MPWDDSPGAGFTGPDVTPWLPLGDHPAAATVAGQRDDPDSTLSLCRRLLALRRAELGGGVTAFANVRTAGGQWAYRTGDLVVATNFTDQPAALPSEAGEILLTSLPGTTPASPGVLRPWEGMITRSA